MENDVHRRPFSWFRSVIVPLVVGVAADIGCFLVIFPLLQHETLSPLGALVILSGLNIVIVSIVALVQTLMGIRPLHKELTAAKAAMAEQQVKDKVSVAQAQVELEAKIRAEFQEKQRKQERDISELRARTGL